MNVASKSAIVIAALAAGAGMVGSPAPVQGRGAPDPYASLPPTMQLTAVVRDFKGRYEPGGHPDFERMPTGTWINGAIVQDELDSDAKPVANDRDYWVSPPWRDAANRTIIDPRPHVETRSTDTAGARSQSVVILSVTSSASFNQWFRDVPGVNLSKPVTLTLHRNAGTGTYTFSSSIDPAYVARKGYFPINGELFGNSDQGVGHANTNYHFTTEISTEFTFERGTGQIFTFTGDDDVWVFIDGKLVIDIGGAHVAISQSIELDRLTWLQDGTAYPMKVFHVERARPESTFRIDTNLRLRMVDLPPVSGMYD